MFKVSARTVALAGLTVLLAAPPAFAHAYLKNSIPSADAAVPAPKRIVLNMSEKLLPQFSGFSILFEDTPVPVTVKIVAGQMVGIPVRPLRAGAYQVKWHAVTSDTHRIEGAFVFKVHP